MKILLDTCTFLWAAEDSRNLSPTARREILDVENEIFLSAISAWEIVVKYHAKRLDLDEPPDVFIPKHRSLIGAESHAVQEQATFHLGHLPDLHRDPFDRLLVCQAIHDGLIILTPDPMIRQYPIRTAW